jgi:hypothetical protein
MTDSATLFRKTARQVSCPINDEVAILDTENSLYFGLEGIAVQVWEALDEPSSIAQLRDRIVSRFDVSADQCEADITRLLADLQAHGLVEVAP